MKTTSTPYRCPGRIVGDFSRRSFLKSSSAGFGWLALSSLLNDEALAERQIGPGPIRARAKNVILCFMDGGPSHVDTFDPETNAEKTSGSGNR